MRLSKWNKRGFTLIETLVAFVLFSLLMMLYLPSFYPELQRLESVRQQTAQWELFSNLVRLELQQQYELQQVQIDTYMERYHENVKHFICETGGCYIEFEHGNQLQVVAE